MPEIKLPPAKELTKEVRDAIAKKLEELEKTPNLPPNKEIKLNDDKAAWGVSYHT